MKVLIFEDEKHTASRLEKLLLKYDSSIEILAVIASVQDGIVWFEQNEAPDLVFQDILLNDGSCFEIFEAVEVRVPIIFTTAYNEYALQSFKLNSIDYVVKPYDFDDIKKALDKFHRMKDVFASFDVDLLKDLVRQQNPNFKKRFLVKVGDKFQSLKSDDVAWFVYDTGVTFAFTFGGNRFPIDYSIDQLTSVIDSEKFFRINRKYLINSESIQSIHTWFNSRLKLHVLPKAEEDIIVSRERVRGFKVWLGQ